MLADNGGITAMSGGGLSAILAADSTKYHNSRYNANAYCGVRLNSNGLQYYATDVGGWLQDTDGGNNPWLESGNAEDFYVRCTLDSGTLDWTDSGTGSWLQLNTTRSWGSVDTTPGVGIETCTVTLEIDTEGDGSNIVATQQYTMWSWNDNGL